MLRPSDALLETIDSYEAQYGCRPASILLTERDYETLAMELGAIKEFAGIPVYCEPDIEKSVLSDIVPYDT